MLRNGRGLKILHTDLEQAIDITSINSHANNPIPRESSLSQACSLSLSLSLCGLSLGALLTTSFKLGAFVRWRQFWRLPAAKNTQISSNLIASNQQPANANACTTTTTTMTTTTTSTSSCCCYSKAGCRQHKQQQQQTAGNNNRQLAIVEPVRRSINQDSFSRALEISCSQRLHNLVCTLLLLLLVL